MSSRIRWNAIVLVRQERSSHNSRRAKALSITIESMYFESRESWVMTVCRRCRVVHSRPRRESMPEIISVYSYVGRGGGDVLTSSVNELYLSGGFIRAASFSPSSPTVVSPVPLLAPPSCCPSTCSCSSASLSPYDPRLFVTDKNSRYTKSALSKLAHSTFWVPGIIHEPAEKLTRDESWWY